MQIHCCQLMRISSDHDLFLWDCLFKEKWSYEKDVRLLPRKTCFLSQFLQMLACSIYQMVFFLFPLCMFIFSWAMMCCGTKCIKACICFIGVIIMLNTTVCSLVVVASSSPRGVFFLVALKCLYLLFLCETFNTPKSCWMTVLPAPHPISDEILHE